ncbi:hypothetical protein ACFLYM_00715 [Chloroflexota bacterium]
MKKVLSVLLAAMFVVTTLGFAPAVYADEAEDGRASAAGKGTLTAQGDGIALIAGRGIVRLKGHGILWIKDVDGNAEIEVSGTGQKEEFPDGWIQYSGFRGTASIKGSKIRVVIAGVDINLHAAGRGGVILWGHGSYEINGKLGRWESERLGKRIMLASEDTANQN